MTKLYRKSEITFAIAWIIAYVVLSSVADQLSNAIGAAKSVTAALHIAMSIVLYLWIRKNGLSKKYGFCGSDVPAGSFLYYLPLAVIASTSLWNGFSLRYGAAGTVFFVVSMCCVGFLEEVIFRGLLLRAMEKNSLRAAVIVSSLTFGLGHIVNALNGSGQSLAETLIQIVFAVLVGFVLVVIFIRGGSLIPCIIFHSVNNALSAFEAEGNLRAQTEMAINLALIVLVLGGYLFYLLKAAPEKTDRSV